MLIGETTQRVQSLYSKGVASDDTRLSSRHIFNKLLTVRSMMFRRRMNKKDVTSNWNTQTIDCVELVEASKNECNCIGDIGSCDVKRSKYKVPETISSDMGDTLTVSSIDGYINYSKTSWDHSKYIFGAKYAAHKEYFYIHNGYVYVINSRAGSIAVTGVFQNPITVYIFQQLCGNEDNCTAYPDIDFEVSNDMIDSIIDESSKELVLEFNRSGREDASNDSRDNIIAETK